MVGSYINTRTMQVLATAPPLAPAAGGPGAGGGKSRSGGESCPRAHWVAVPQALRARRVKGGSHIS
jgi:hypothetical protein